MDTGDNPNPQVFEKVRSFRAAETLKDLWVELPEEPCDSEEIFRIIRNIQDPEHPDVSLEQLNVLDLDHVEVKGHDVHVRYTPTVPNCSVATLIGLMIATKLERTLPRGYKVDVDITPGKHDQEAQVNKQLADKERVAAALENPSLSGMINQYLADTDEPLDPGLVFPGYRELYEE
eukprot:GEMP01052818.1.p1 GENE.GEMP01052818.1~~GEMP01052818.1.p1  ORF type:complete len:183 (+),score=29.41 GEMP01052818.1:23-550(+)